jgi:hypothetical protein
MEGRRSRLHCVEKLLWEEAARWSQDRLQAECRRVLEKLTVSQLVKKFHTFYETGMSLPH